MNFRFIVALWKMQDVGFPPERTSQNTFPGFSRTLLERNLNGILKHPTEKITKFKENPAKIREHSTFRRFKDFKKICQNTFPGLLLISQGYIKYSLKIRKL